MGTTRKVIIIGSGPGRLHGGDLRRSREPGPADVHRVCRRVASSCSRRPSRTIPGFVDGVMGPELMETMRKQAERFGTEMIAEDVTAVDFSRRPFVVKVGDTAYEAETVIMATGASAKLLGLPGERELMGRGVSTCATCDGFFFRTRTSWWWAAATPRWRRRSTWRAWAARSTVVHRRDTPARLEDHAGARVQEPEDHLRLGHRVERDRRSRGRQGDRGGASCATSRPARSPSARSTALFVAIGHEPNTALAAGPGRPAAQRLRQGRARARRGPRCPASSPPATWPTTRSARR